jgi:hypothetical protein
MTDQMTAVDPVARKAAEDLADCVRALLERVQQLEAYVHQEPETDPVAEAFFKHRDKARATTARQREGGL